MRDIRFRAWDRDDNYMLVEDFIGNHDDLHLDDLNKIFARKDLVFMQYTGLKDKNGKEIYEGDIVKTNCCGGELVFKIIWEENNTRFKRENAPYLSGGVPHGEGCEVIGNIYENPELLEKE